MAIIKGAINFGSNFNIGAKGPIDARQRVETIADLTTAWTEDIPAYKDMVVAVEEDHNLYILTADDATVSDNWKLIGDVSGDITNLQGQIDIINGTGVGSFKKAVSDAKTELIGDDATIDTIKHAEKLATDASDKVDTKIAEEVERANAAYATAAQGTLADNAVRAVVEGKTNGTISVTTGTGAPTDVKVKGLGSAAYTDSNAYATAAQGTKADAADTLSKANKAAIDKINGDASTTGSFAKGDADTLTAAKKYTDDSIASLDVTGNTSDAVKGVTITVNETDGKVIKPVVSIAAGTVGGASDANLVTGDTVKTYVDTTINDALVWHDIA